MVDKTTPTTADPTARGRERDAALHIDKDVWAGLFFMGLAALGLFIGADYAFGTAARMGAGFLPKLLCWSLLALGALVTLIGIIRRGEPMEAWDWGQLLAILTAVLVFGAVLEAFGLEIAILGAVLIGGVAAPEPTRLERRLLVVLSIGLSLFLWPGATAKLGKVTGIASVSAIALSALLALAVLTIALHTRRVPMATFIERVLLALGMGVVAIIIFVDALGLTMKSSFVMDIWTIIKTSLIKPIFQIFR